MNRTRTIRLAPDNTPWAERPGSFQVVWGPVDVGPTDFYDMAPVGRAGQFGMYASLVWHGDEGGLTINGSPESVSHHRISQTEPTDVTFTIDGQKIPMMRVVPQGDGTFVVECRSDFVVECGMMPDNDCYGTWEEYFSRNPTVVPTRSWQERLGDFLGRSWDNLRLHFWRAMRRLRRYSS